MGQSEFRTVRRLLNLGSRQVVVNVEAECRPKIIRVWADKTHRANLRRRNQSHPDGYEAALVVL